MTGELITFPIRLYARGARLLLSVAEDVTGKAVMGTLRVAGALGNLRGGDSAAPAYEPPASAQRPARPRPPARPARPRPPARSRAAATEAPAAPTEAPPAPAADLPEPDPRIAERVEREPPPAEPPRPRGRPRTRPATRRPAPTNGAGEPLAGERATQDEGVAPVELDGPPTAEPDHVSESPTVVRESAEPGVEEGVGAAVNIHEPWEGYGRMSARDVVGRLSALSAAELAAVQLYETANRKRQTVLNAVERELAKPNR